MEIGSHLLGRKRTRQHETSEEGEDGKDGERSFVHLL
jgi:hypothetical protein